MKQLFTLVLAAMAFVACTQNEVEELTANRADVPETLTVGFEGGDTRIELNEALKTVWTEGDEVSVFYRSYENTRWAFQGETGDRSGELKLVSGEAGAQTMDNSIIVYPYSDSYAINADTHAVAASLPAVQSYKSGSYGAEGNIMVAESKFTQFTLKSVVGWLRVELTGNRHIVNSITLRGNDGEQVAGLCYINAADASVALAESDVDESLVATEVRLNCGSGVTLDAEATEFYIALLPQTFDKGLTVEVNYANAEPQTLVYEDSITIRRNHISPINIEAQGEAIIRTDKLFYTATALVDPYDASAFNVSIVSNEWNEATGEGVITFNGELTTIGYEAFAYCDSLTSVTIPDSVTTIGDSAFYHCASLTSVTIPESVTTIGEAAFRSCDSLTSVRIPDSVTTIGDIAFYHCTSLTSVTIGDSVTTIGVGAFNGCSSLTSVTIPESVTTIGKAAFSHCTSLTSVTIPDSVTTIGDAAFSDCNNLTSVTIPESVTTIGEGAFKDCTSLTSVTIPESVTTIGGAAFGGCVSLTSVTIPESVTTIGDSAFAHCLSLTSVTIGDSVTTIGNMAFEDCDRLTSVTIPESVTTIGVGVFLDCEILTSVYCKAITPPTLGRSVFYENKSGRKIYVPAESVEAYKAAENWSEYADDIVGYDFGAGEEVIVVKSELFYTSTALVEPDEATAFNVAIVSNEWDETTGEGVITFDGELTTIGEWAFYDCGNLTSVTIPESVTTIGNNAFWYCGNLTSVTIPESVTTIGDYAFRHCSSLTSVTIPTNTTTIGEGAFIWCESLTSVTIPNNVTTIGNGAFAACISLAEFKGKFAADGGRCLIKDNTIIAYANASGTTYTIGDSVTSIGDYAFHSCSSLTSVTIPESVTTIGDHAFIYCDSLTSVYCKATTPPAGGVGMFYDTSATIYVPEDSLREYKMAENWSEYADYIVGYNFEAGEETPETPSDFVPTHTATKWLWSGASTYGNKYVVSGDGFTIDVHFPTSVATESSLATGEYVWMVTSFFSNSDATNFTTRSFKLGGSDDTVPISDGSAKVTASGDTYTIQLTLVHRDSGYEYMIEYVGKLNDTGEQGGGEVNPDGAIKLTGFVYEMDMCSHYLGYFWRASGENVSLGVAITSRSCTQDSINAGDYVYNAYPDDIEYAFQLRNSTYNGVSVGDSNSTMKVEKSGEEYKITIVASGYTFVYEGTLN